MATATQGRQGRAPRRWAGCAIRADGEKGFRREPAGKGFAYFDAKGERVSDEAQIERFKRLAIPPAWTAVWILR